MKRKLLLVIATAVTVFFAISIATSIAGLYSAGNRIQAEQQSLAQLQQQNKDLKVKITQAEQKGYIEKKAHNDLNMVLPGETVVVLPQAATMSASFSQTSFEKPLPNWQRWWRLFFE